jgi:hypothetical protein
MDLALSTWKYTLPVKNIVCGFVLKTQSPARITVNEQTAYVGIDGYLFMRCVVIGATAFNGKPLDIAYCNDMTVLHHEYHGFISQNLDPRYTAVVVSVIRAAWAYMHFVLHHEFNHLQAGHMPLRHDYGVMRELVRSMEFAADNSAMSSALFVLATPSLDNDNLDMNALTDLPEAFGFVLSIMFVMAAQNKPPPSLYPSTSERIIALIATNLVSCQENKEWATLVFDTIRRETARGIMAGLSKCKTSGMVVCNEVFQLFKPENMCRLNCVGCSSWAKKIKEIYQPIFDEISANEEIFLTYRNSLHGFDIRNFNTPSLHSAPKIYCKWERKYYWRNQGWLERIKSTLRFYFGI